VERGTRQADAVGVLLDRRYRVTSVLARGGMSTVYRGVDTRLDRPVAVKIMDPRFAGDPSFLDRFTREARAAAKLHHPAVVAVHDQGVDGEHVFLVMELVEGGTLRDLLIERGELPVPLAFAVLEPVLSALAAAHRAGLVHRDVKPENVLIGSAGEVKVADFGLVRALAEARTTSDDLILGTVAYLSPEQVARGTADARSDVYAAGILLYETLTGAPPFTGDNALSVAYRHVNDEVPGPAATIPGIPEPLDDLVRRATRRDPADRPVDAAAFLVALQRVRGLLGVDRMPVPAPAVPGDDDGTERIDRRDRAAAGPPPRPAPAAHPWEHTAPTRPAGPAGGRQPPGPTGTRALTRAQTGLPAAPSRPRPERPLSPAARFARRRTRDRRVVIIWLVLILLLACLVGVGAWYVGIGRWSAVPTLPGLDRGGAQDALTAADLTAKVVPGHDNVVPSGRVIRTDPAAGTRVLRGHQVTVVLSEGRPTVPAVLGLPLEQAQQAVAGADLTLRHDQQTDAFDDTVPAGAVLRVTPAAGTTLTVGAAVSIVLSRGKPIRIPDVRGQHPDQALATLRAAGLSPTVIGDATAQAVVVDLSPRPGTVADPNDLTVRVTVSDQVSVPVLLGGSVNEAKAALAKLGLTVQVSQLFGGGDSRVIDQNPFPGTKVTVGSTVQINAFP
jgi:serine/threonine-protein kinase